MLIHGERKEGTEKIEVFSPYSGECVGKWQSAVWILFLKL